MRRTSSGSAPGERRLQVGGESFEGRRCRRADRAANGILDAEPILARDRDAGVGAQGVHDDGEKDLVEPRVAALLPHASAEVAAGGRPVDGSARRARWTGSAGSGSRRTPRERLVARRSPPGAVEVRDDRGAADVTAVRAGQAGTQNQNRAPPPGRSSYPIAPPWAWTAAAAVARPSPAPGDPAGRALANGSNSDERKSGGTPGPRSSTSTRRTRVASSRSSSAVSSTADAGRRESAWRWRAGS